MEKRDNKRKILTGVVVGDKMMKTRVIQVESMRLHPKYRKQVKHYVRFKAHDEKNEAKNGDVVSIMETRRLSKDKRWMIAEIISKGEGTQGGAI